MLVSEMDRISKFYQPPYYKLLRLDSNRKNFLNPQRTLAQIKFGAGFVEPASIPEKLS